MWDPRSTLLASRASAVPVGCPAFFLFQEGFFPDSDTRPIGHRLDVLKGNLRQRVASLRCRAFRAAAYLNPFVKQ